MTSNEEQLEGFNMGQRVSGSRNKHEPNGERGRGKMASDEQMSVLKSGYSHVS